jgi:hypothetical protein
MSLGSLPHLDLKGEGNSSMAEGNGRREGVEGGPLLNPRDMAKAGLPEFQSPDGQR